MEVPRSLVSPPSLIFRYMMYDFLITFPFHSGRFLDLSSCEYSNGRNHLMITITTVPQQTKLEWEEVALPLDQKNEEK